MYDMPQIRDANDRFWSAIRTHLGFGPAALTRDRDMWDVWQSTDLICAQTCGLPFRTRLHSQVALIGTPDYGVRGCPPGYYRSVLVARANDPRRDEAAFSGATFAYNEALSQSGWSAPMLHLKTLNVPMGHLIRTGAHAASAMAVAEGHADLAGIDAVTWQLLCRHEPAARLLRVLAQTSPTPGLPFIASRAQNPTVIASAISRAIADLPAEDRAALCLKGIVQIPAETYLAVPTAPPPAE